LAGHGGEVASAAWSPDGARVVTASDDNTARVWDAATDTEIASFKVIKGYERAIEVAAWSPDGARIVSALDDDTAQVWDAATGKEIVRLKGHCPPLPEGHRWHSRRVTNVRCAVNNAAWTPDGARIVTASVDHTARVWDAATGKEIARLEGHDGSVLSAAWSPDGVRLVTESDDNTARVWEAATGKEIARVEGHGGGVGSAAWTLQTRASGTVLIIAALADGNVRLWQVFGSTQELVNAAKDHMRRCLTPAQRKQYFLPDAPPLWCVERRLWPYHTDDWQVWLAAHKSGHEVALPQSSRQ
jgi:WD40 repeat protein